MFKKNHNKGTINVLQGGRGQWSMVKCWGQLLNLKFDSCDLADGAKLYKGIFCNLSIHLTIVVSVCLKSDI